MQTTISLQEELQCRLKSSLFFLDIDPTAAIPEMLSWSWLSTSNQLFYHSWLLQQLQQSEQANATRQQASVAAGHAFGYANTYEYYDALMNCFKHALFSGNAKAASEWAVVLQKKPAT